ARLRAARPPLLRAQRLLPPSAHHLRLDGLGEDRGRRRDLPGAEELNVRTRREKHRRIRRGEIQLLSTEIVGGATMTQGRKVIWQEVKSEQRLVFGLAWLAMLALTIPVFTAGYWQCLAWMDLDPSVPLRDQPGRFGF